MNHAETPQHFAGANSNAKFARAIANLVRRARLDYDGFRRVCADVRKLTGLRRPARGKRLPRILPDEALKRFYEAVQRAGNLQHELLLRLLFYTAARVSELTDIEVSDIDFDACKIFIGEGKGDKDRFILFPDDFRLALKTHLAAHPENRYVFESRQRTKYSTRRVQQIVGEYGEAAGIEQKVHPHLFRHQMLTWLTAQGLPDAQIQLISGHASKKSLEVYQHLSLASVRPAYQRAMKDLNI